MAKASNGITFQRRSEAKELMDDFQLSGEELKKNLDELEVINYWLGGNQVTLTALEEVIKKSKYHSAKEMKIADLGAGGGDMLKLMAEWGRRKKLKINFVGIDANAFMIQYAENKTRNYREITYHQADVLDGSFSATSFEIVTCSLFCHHFTDEELLQLFKRLYTEVRLAVVINDLHRHWFAYYSIKFLTRLFGGSYLVKNDAPLSVLRAFNKKELENLLKKTGISHFRIRWKWAFRYQVIFYSQNYENSLQPKANH